MSENSRELISALVDNELETGSVFILNALKENQEYRQVWQHYHLIGETLRGNLPEQIDINLVNRVSEAIQNESLPSIHGQKRLQQFLKPLTGFAIAASVTVVAILGIKQTEIEPGATGSSTPVVASNSITPENGNYRFATTTTTPVITNNQPQSQQYAMPVDAESRLNRYLVNYNEYRSNVGVQGILPYVRIVAHEVEE